jgi:hypothetical protein
LNISGTIKEETGNIRQIKERTRERMEWESNIDKHPLFSSGKREDETNQTASLS